MSPQASSDARALDDVILNADEVRVYDGGLAEDGPLQSPAVLRLSGQSDVAEVNNLLRVAAVTDGLCMCLGSSVLEFFAVGKRIAIVGLHHGRSLRWSGWTGDAELVDGGALLRWLDSRGYRTPLDQARADEERHRDALKSEARWSEAAPESVADLLPALLETSRFGHIEPQLIAEVAQRTVAGPEASVAEYRQLLAWHASGTGKSSGYPVHEGIPGLVLSGLPLGTLLEALDSESLGSEAWSGFMRHMADWRSRTGEELNTVPEHVWDELVRLSEVSGDDDIATRIANKRKEAQA